MVSFDQIELHIVNKHCTILVEISFFGSHLNKWKNCQKTCQNRYKKNCQKLPKKSEKLLKNVLLPLTQSNYKLKVWISNVFDI